MIKKALAAVFVAAAFYASYAADTNDTAQLTGKINELQLRLQALESASGSQASLIKQVQELRDQLTELRKNAAGASATNSQAAEAVQKQIQYLRDQVAQLRTKISDTSAASASTNSSAQAATARQIQDLRDQIAELRGKREPVKGPEQRAQKRGKKVSIDDLALRIQGLEASGEGQEQRIKGLETSGSSQSSQQLTQDAQIKDLRSQLTQLQGKRGPIDDLGQRVQALKNTNITNQSNITSQIQELRDQLTQLRGKSGPIDELGQRVQSLESISAAASPQEAATVMTVGMVNQMQDFREQIAQLRGNVEVLQHQSSDNSRERQSLYTDLDNRLRRLESGTANSAPQASSASPLISDDANAYEVAFSSFRANNYQKAAESFNEFIHKYSDSKLLPNAYYWAGNSNLKIAKPDIALQMFTAIISRWPTHDKAPDALLGKYNAQQALADTQGARQTLRQLIAAYPESTAAAIAQKNLAQ